MTTLLPRVVRVATTVAIVGSVAWAIACSPASPLDPPAVRSCRGERVLECDPYEWAIATAATLTPTDLLIGDPRRRALVTVDLETCGGPTPSPPTVDIFAVVGADDAGGPGRVISLTTVRATTPDATHIEATIDNPFNVAVPRDTDIMLRFLPVVGGCDGEPIEIPYHTGPIFM